MDYLQYMSLKIMHYNRETDVLNLVINGLPSIQTIILIRNGYLIQIRFKPCYKWITFNTGRSCG